jgi:uncharacterized damage-inducible protein DinB
MRDASAPLRAHFGRLISHLEWADRRVQESLRASRDIPAKALELYAHILGAEHTWLSRITGDAPRFAVWPSVALDECESLMRVNAEKLTDIVKGVTVDSLATSITYRNSAGQQFTSSLEDILTHVALHGSYHRGQIASLLRLAGETPNATDYIAFVRGAPAATRQP